MKKLIILPYKMGSESARLIARELGCRRVYPDRHYRYKRNHVILNWGSSTCPQWHRDGVVYLNNPVNVAVTCNKISTFHVLNQSTILGEVSTIPLPAFTTLRSNAERWIEEGKTVYCRTTVVGKGGEGIVVATNIDEIVDAKLYTQGVNNDKEYRVHVFDGRVIAYAYKGRRRATEDEESRPSHLVRNHTKGWVFVREGVELPQVVAETAVKAVRALGLTFGAVDICTVKGSSEPTACVFEVNTACGMTEGGTTLKRYVQAIKEKMSCYTY